MTEENKVIYKPIPFVDGPLTHFDRIRPDVLECVTQRSLHDFQGMPLETVLEEVLYLEKTRIRRTKYNIFTRARKREDSILLSKLKQGLINPNRPDQLENLMRAIVEHYSEEIGGHFSRRVYLFASRALPLAFSWLLNAAVLKKFNPWQMEQSLESRLRIVGEIEHLKKLSKHGTILIVPTHQSNIDSVLVGYAISLMHLPAFSYGAGLNLYSNPLLSYFLNRLGAYKVDRSKSNDVYKKTLKNYSTEILTRGIHSIFFPGGGRSRSGAIESKLKLGLLGTALEAQIENYNKGIEKPNVYIVPMITSYHFVLEASSLIEDFLLAQGKQRFINVKDESWQIFKVGNFFWDFFGHQSSITTKIGRPLDVFGNFVDEEGRSLGPNGTIIDPKKWFTSQGEIKREEQRDREYTRELGERIVDRFFEENVVLSSHLVAFAFFEAIRKKFPNMDVYHLMRLSASQRSLDLEEFYKFAETMHSKFKRLADDKKVCLAPRLIDSDTKKWVRNGIKNLGPYHSHSVLKIGRKRIWTEDMNLLYYYRNRLSGYGMSRLAKSTRKGEVDEQGFLA